MKHQCHRWLGNDPGSELANSLDAIYIFADLLDAFKYLAFMICESTFANLTNADEYDRG